MSEKIAILTDSGSDVPKDQQEKYGIFVAPLNIHYHDRTYQDNVNITPNQVYERINEEIPTTSTPTGEQIHAVLEDIQKQEYTHVIVVTISSGLSGTLNAIRMQSEEFPEMTFAFIDTKNIGIASGMAAILGARCLEAGKDFQTTVAEIEASLPETRIFFYVDTLKYLQKGGRIGHVAGMVGQLLNIKPIISCDAEGIYYPIAKERGAAKAIKKMVSLAEEFAGDEKDISIIVVNADEHVESEKIFQQLKTKYPQAREIRKADISPVLGVHTGPKSIGIAVQKHR